MEMIRQCDCALKTPIDDISKEIMNQFRPEGPEGVGRAEFWQFIDNYVPSSSRRRLFCTVQSQHYQNVLYLLQTALCGFSVINFSFLGRLNVMQASVLTLGMCLTAILSPILAYMVDGASILPMYMYTVILIGLMTAFLVANIRETSSISPDLYNAEDAFHFNPLEISCFLFPSLMLTLTLLSGLWQYVVQRNIQKLKLRKDWAGSSAFPQILPFKSKMTSASARYQRTKGRWVWIVLMIFLCVVGLVQALITGSKLAHGPAVCHFGAECKDPQYISGFSFASSCTCNDKTLDLRGKSSGALLDLTRWTQLESLDLSQNQLLSLPNQICDVDSRRLVRLDVSSNNLMAIPACFGGFRHLREFWMQSNKLEEVPESLYQMPSLRILDVSSNFIVALSNDLGQLTNLQVLRASHNKLTSIPDSIGRLEKLESLDVSYNGMTDLPRMSGMKNLRKLQAVHAGLERLPEDFIDLTELAYCDISQNYLRELPENMSRLSKLSKLLVAGNNITSLPEDLPLSAQLEELDISHNYLTYLPISIGQSRSLKILSASENLLSSLPNFGKSSKLTQLLVSGNRLSALPASIGKLDFLSVLYVSTNKLTSLPESMAELQSVRSLDISNNKLESLPDIFAGLPQLSSLELAHNQLTSLPYSLGWCPKLMLLDASYNQLTNISGFFEGGDSRLQTLNLRANNINFLPDSTNKLKFLSHLDLSYNRITELPSLAGLDNLAIVDMSNNQFRTVPKQLDDLSALAELSLAHNLLSLRSFPEQLNRDIRTLDLSGNQLTAVPPAIRTLHSMHTLDISENPVATLPSWIRELGGLRKLLASNTNLKSPLALPCTDSMRHLDISHSKLDSLSESTSSECAQMFVLDASYNSLVVLPESLSSLKKLHQL